MPSDQGNGATRAGTSAVRLSHRDVDRARRALAGRVHRTPVVHSGQLTARYGVRLWMKAENLQRGGSFKLRGALLAVDRLVAAGSRGVLAQSTGNHAIAVALAAREHRIPAMLVLPSDASPVKVRRIREAGAEVVFAGKALAERAAAVLELRDRYGYEVVDPYEDPVVVAGQGTATAELIEQVSAEGGRLDAVVVPVGGGSAIAGACLAAHPHDVAVVGAEPEAVPALTAAMHAGKPVSVGGFYTIADGLRPDRIGDLPFELAHREVAAVVTVDERAIADAMRATLLHARLVVEPAAATALAGAVRYAEGRRIEVGVLLTGGNVEPDLLASLLAESRPTSTAGPSAGYIPWTDSLGGPQG
ncbi:threonine/serine dehydratase [Micromonospora sp. NBC_01699]|uniref:threonine ammonia-lyase n=1 Tax=Micromonospora sp. NBC_01699 TaxID=2975984 RepID=UPI002E294F72|nr:threonine/serine dehydratase [Micromonospora sp. NBC_01699]